MSELTRANKVTVKANVDGRYVADFYRTHKHILTVLQGDTNWEIPQGMTKSGERELFRAYLIEHAEKFGIEWKPEDMRSEENKRKASYPTEEDLVTDATSMIIPHIRGLIDKCKYGVEWKGITHDDTVPMEKTGKGTLLSALGIIDGKYEKSGNWAWANVNFTVTMGFKESEIYKIITVELVSGQLKKPKLGINAFNDMIKTEIIADGLATEDELDPPKKPVTKAEPTEESTEEDKSESVVDKDDSIIGADENLTDNKDIDGSESTITEEVHKAIKKQRRASGKKSEGTN